MTRLHPTITGQIFSLPIRLIFVSACLGTCANAQTATADNADLPQQLIEQGWQATAAPDGSTLIYPPGTQSAASNPGAETTAAAVRWADIDQLLRDRGWELRETAAGETLLRRIAPPDPGTDSADPVTAAPAQAQPTPTQSAPAHDIHELLEARGWTVETDAAGNTLLIPKGGAAPGGAQITSQRGGSPVGSVDSQVSQAWSDFRKAVEDTGWRVESGPDEALVIYPPHASDAQAAPPISAGQQVPQGCECLWPESVSNGRIALPLANAEAAARLARDWIASSALDGQTIGKTRRVNSIYVVSVVDAAPPYRLRNQLVIRRDNGRIFVVF